MNIEESLRANSTLLWMAAAAVGLVFLVRMLFKVLGHSGPYCVKVWESGGSTSEQSFDSFKDAREYADDAASEEEEPRATVYDARGHAVYRGRHYTSRYPG